jgi:hypothetical protein
MTAPRKPVGRQWSAIVEEINVQTLTADLVDTFMVGESDRSGDDTPGHRAPSRTGGVICVNRCCAC